MAKVIGGETVHAVLAKELHCKLGETMDFDAWLKQQKKRNGLEDGIDFSHLENGCFVTVEAALFIARTSQAKNAGSLKEYLRKCNEVAKKYPPEPIQIRLKLPDKSESLSCKEETLKIRIDINEEIDEAELERELIMSFVYDDILSAIEAHFGVEHWRNIPSSRFDEVMDFILNFDVEKLSLKEF